MSTIIQELIPQTEGNEEILQWVNTTLAKHIDKTTLGEAEHILDFLKSDRAPKRLRKMSFTQARESAHKWTEALKKRGQDICETEADVDTVKQYKNGARWVKLISKASYLREGNLMSHCVGSYHDKKDLTIYSLRDSKNVPHCTMEVRREGSEVSQVKGKGNGCIHPKYIKYVLSFCDKVIGKPIRPNEMQYLGYIQLEDYEWTFFSQFKGMKELTVGGVRYMYKYSKLEKV